MIELEGYSDLISSWWNIQLNRNPLSILSKKLKRVKRALINLNIQHGNLSTNDSTARAALHSVQTLLSGNHMDFDLRAKERENVPRICGKPFTWRRTWLNKKLVSNSWL